MRRLAGLAAAAMLGLAGCSGEGADTQPYQAEAPGAPEDVLPLERGVYVLADMPCEDPPNAAIRVFDGRGLSGSATRACRVLVDRHDGGAHVVEQSCVDTYSGERTSERQVVRLRGREGFQLETPYSAGTYRLCPLLDPAHLTG